MSDFLSLFDEYVSARAKLRAIPDEDETDQRYWISHLASLWNRVVDARNESGECVCPTCGLRHGSRHEQAKF